MALQATLLSIAGSDPSGGAGIQADLKTMCSIGVYGAAAITCLTVQNGLGVQRIHPLSPDLVRAQVRAVLDAHHVTHIKIGMTGSVEILQALGETLAGFSGEVIHDPVLAASTGESLLQSNGLKALKIHLLGRVSYLTPNIPELQLLAGREINAVQDALACGASLLKDFPSLLGVVVKGGHLDETASHIRDYLLLQNGEIHQSERPRLQNRNLHGTGCTYASALASYLCLGRDPVAAFLAAGEYMDAVISAGLTQGVMTVAGNGPLLHHLRPKTQKQL